MEQEKLLAEIASLKEDRAALRHEVERLSLMCSMMPEDAVSLMEENIDLRTQWNDYTTYVDSRLVDRAVTAETELADTKERLGIVEHASMLMERRLKYAESCLRSLSPMRDEWCVRCKKAIVELQARLRDAHIQIHAQAAVIQMLDCVKK